MKIKMQKTLTLFLSSILLLVASTAAHAEKTPGFNNKIPEYILTPDTVYATGILELDRDRPTVVVIPPDYEGGLDPAVIWS